MAINVSIPNMTVADCGCFRPWQLHVWATCLKVYSHRCVSLRCVAVPRDIRVTFEVVFELPVNTDGGRCNLERVEKIKDLGVTVAEKLKFYDHIHEKVNKAYSMLGIIKRNFRYMDKASFLCLCISLWWEVL